jgi:hypothetical protein
MRNKHNGQAIEGAQHGKLDRRPAACYSPALAAASSWILFPDCPNATQQEQW